jgi:hypothetical protein
MLSAEVPEKALTSPNKRSAATPRLVHCLICTFAVSPSLVRGIILPTITRDFIVG